jgi:hypothetical protein
MRRSKTTFKKQSFDFVMSDDEFVPSEDEEEEAKEKEKEEERPVPVAVRRAPVAKRQRTSRQFGTPVWRRRCTRTRRGTAATTRYVVVESQAQIAI